jgi:hypothetical protein
VSVVSPAAEDGPYRPPTTTAAGPIDELRVYGMTSEEAQKLANLWQHSDDSGKEERRRRANKRWHSAHLPGPRPRTDEL